MELMADVLKWLSVAVFVLSALAILIRLASEFLSKFFGRNPLGKAFLTKTGIDKSFEGLSRMIDRLKSHINSSPVLKELLILLKIASLVIATRIFIYIIGYLGVMLIQNTDGGLLDSFQSIWNKWDADHYVFSAENWYVTYGDKKFLIVFFPFYPILINMLYGIINSYFWSGILVSNLSLIAACYYLYKLVKLDFEESIAFKSVKYLLFFPVSFFLAATFSESTFIALSVMTLYYARKERWLLVGVLGFFAAFTRSLGILLIVPVFIEYVFSDSFKGLFKRKTANSTRISKLQGLFILLIPCALLVYLYINKSITGDWFKFLDYQKNHWNQSFGFFADNIKGYYLNIANASWKPADRASLWIPQLSVILLSFGLLYTIILTIYSSNKQAYIIKCPVT